MFTFNFAPEIEDRIFEWATHLFPRGAPQLTVICKRVQTRVERLIYESLFFCEEAYRGLPEVANIERFTYTLEARPTEFFAGHVRNIFMTYKVTWTFAKLLLAKCTKVRNLVLWIMTFDHPGYGSMVLPLSSTLVAISTSKVILNDMSASGIVFPNVQYVGLVYGSKQPLSSLKWLPNAWKMQMQLDKQPSRSDLWLRDAKVAIATAPLIEVYFIVDPMCVTEVESRKDELGDGADIFITSDHEDGIQRWRMRNIYDELDI
ncbi:hypothetical protein C0989_001756 [Termitomyces sp. Mn162]|nr:hypothetical protein C0989_001756 [Termitomyces sp. Mn162]